MQSGAVMKLSCLAIGPTNSLKGATDKMTGRFPDRRGYSGTGTDITVREDAPENVFRRPKPIVAIPAKGFHVENGPDFTRPDTRTQTAFLAHTHV